MGFEVLGALTVKSSVVWNVSPYSPVKDCRLFGGNYGIKFAMRTSEPRKQPTNRVVCFLRLFAWPARGPRRLRQYISSTGLHGITSQEIVHFIRSSQSTTILSSLEPLESSPHPYSLFPYYQADCTNLRLG